MQLTITIHDSWATIPVALSRVLLALGALEKPRQPGDDGEGLTELLAGLEDDPEPAPAASPAASTPPAREWDGVPRGGKCLYKLATTRKALPAVNRIGKQFNYPRLVSDWSDDQVAAAYRILTEPAANGAASR
jgi:hypothetical protein